MSQGEAAEIKQAIKELSEKFDRLMFGQNGDNGIVGRVGKIEEREKTRMSHIAGLWTGFVAIAAAVVGAIASGWRGGQ